MERLGTQTSERDADVALLAPVPTASTELATHTAEGVIEARILDNMALAASLVPRGIKDAEDLRQVAFEVLVRIAPKFDETRGVLFSTYLTPSVKGQIKRYFRDYGWGVGVARSLQESFLQVGQANERLTHRLGRKPNIYELGAELDFSTEQIEEAHQLAVTGRAVDSINRPLNIDGLEATVVDTLADEKNLKPDEVDELLLLKNALKQLDERDRKAIDLYFGHDFTQEEIARELGVSQMHVSRILQKTIKQLGILLTENPE